MKTKSQILKLQKPKCDGVRGKWKENNRKGKKKKNPTSLSFACACLNSNFHFLHQLFWFQTPFVMLILERKDQHCCGTNTVVGPTSRLSSTKEKESDESLLLSLSLSLVVLSRFSQNPNFGNAGSENPSNICRRRLSLWIDPESEIGFLGLEVLWKPWEEGKNSSQDRSLLKTKGPDFFFFFLEEEEEHLVQQPLGSMIKGNKKEFSRNLVMGEAKKHCKLEWVSDWVSAYMLAWALTAAVMAASSLTYSAHCTGRPHGCLLHFHLSSQVREGESWSSFFLSPHAWRNLSTEMWSCLLVCCFFTNSNGGFVFLGPQRIYLSPNATTMHLCLNFADAFMWANAESMALIVELACLLAAFFTKSMQNTPRDNLSNSTVDSQFWVLMLFVAVCRFFLLMLSFTWGKCWIYLLKRGACLHAAATSQILNAKKKKTMDSFPSFKQLLGGGSGLGFRV